MTVSYEDFKKIEIKLGKIISAEIVAGADKLLKLSVNFNEENPRQIISGIREFIEDPVVLIGKKCFFVTNLEPRIIKGLTSEGMLFATGGEEGEPFSLMYADDEVKEGSVAR